MPLHAGGYLLPGLVCCVVGASGPSQVQPEDKLLDPSALRGELLRRGMNDLLQAYLDECPPESELDKLIYERQRQLAVHADKRRDEDECLAALDKAIALLEQAIEKHPNDPRAIDWRLELGKDLIYKRAEPYYNNILFRGGSKEDREQLLAITTRATKVFDDLIKVIERWNLKLQQLGETELRKLENSGEIARYRTLELQSRYFASWAQFYRALATAPGKERDKLLADIITYFTVEKKEWIETDHKDSGVQCQSLLLLGMTYRLAGKADQAVKYLGQAVKRAEALTDPAEKRSLGWVANLGKMEEVKVLRDSGEYDKALAGIQAITKSLSDETQSLSLELAAVLLEGSIYAKQADEAAAKKDKEAQAKLLAKSREPLIALATRRPQAKARIYSSVYPLLGKDPDPKKLGPFDQNVLVAGLLADAARAQQRIEQVRKEAGASPNADQQKQIAALETERAASLNKAITSSELLLADESKLAKELRAEALFNLGVCCYQRGQALRAVETFTRLLREHPKFDRGKDAILYAVQIASELNMDPANRDRPEIRTAFIEALRGLTRQYPDSAEAKYWQFFLANTLDLAGQARAAAEAYAKVDPTHEDYLDAQYYRVNCLVRLFSEAASSESADPSSLKTQVSEVIDQARACNQRITESLGAITDKQRRDTLTRSAGDVLLTAAQLTNEPPLTDYKETLDILKGFEDRYSAYRDLIGRAMRLKIVALQGLDQLDKAKQLIPDYLKRDPENAGATLGALLASMQREVTRAKERNDLKAARKAASEAVELAKWLYQWAQDNRKQLKPDEIFGIRVQYAQACLEADQFDQARTLFEQCREEDAARSESKEPSHGPTLLGLAESHYRLGLQAAKDGKYDKARQELQTASKEFLAIWRRSPRHSDLWWQALLRALETPVELRDVSVSQAEKGGLTEQQRQELAAIPGTLDRVEQTIRAERLTDNKLGGHDQAFRRLEARIDELRKRAGRLRLGP
ncbi:MAG: tetratricopeptide repeat protein [Phycisphaerae bacterium]|nr:tetratricopeptide repeat protein [Phycisphaerae bacterium]